MPSHPLPLFDAQCFADCWFRIQESKLIELIFSIIHRINEHCVNWFLSPARTVLMMMMMIMIDLIEIKAEEEEEEKSIRKKFKICFVLIYEIFFLFFVFIRAKKNLFECSRGKLNWKVSIGKLWRNFFFFMSKQQQQQQEKKRRERIYSNFLGLALSLSLLICLSMDLFLGEKLWKHFLVSFSILLFCYYYSHYWIGILFFFRRISSPILIYVFQRFISDKFQSVTHRHTETPK